jgi:hypothetical protein
MRRSDGRGTFAKVLGAVRRALGARGKETAARRGGLRASLHVTLSDADVERALGNVTALRRALLGVMYRGARRGRAERPSARRASGQRASVTA